MQKRTFLRLGGLFAAGVVIAPEMACSSQKALGMAPTVYAKRTTPFEVPALKYSSGALEPYIDKTTMEIHHDKHHGAYVKNLNEAVKTTRFADMEVGDILKNITASDPAAIRNNAGGHYNHTMFWENMAPNAGGSPSGDLSSALTATFGSFDKFKEQFNAAAKGVFGSGWAWLCLGADKKLFITSTPNQDNPLMGALAKQPGTPLLGLDVWEHAYYLKYQNKRPDYINAFYNVVDWNKVGERFSMAGK